MKQVVANITVLTNEQIELIHDSSLRILATTGVRVDSERARNVFAQWAGVSVEDRIIHIPADLVEFALKAAPSTVDIFDRTGNNAFRLSAAGNEPTRFGIGVTNLWYQMPMNDQLESFTRQHARLAARLGNHLNEYDVVSTPGVLNDISPNFADLIATLELSANTTKPLVLLISDAALFAPALDLLEFLHGDLAARPFIIPYFNPITPLVMNEETTNNMFAAIGRGLTFIYSNYGMSGSTTPITPAGTLALLNAELLAGLALSQLIKNGASVILGSLPAAFNMQTMISHYTPHSMLLNLACAEMMAFYGIPHCGTSGSGNGWGADLLAGDALWMNHLSSCLGKVGLCPFVGGNFDSLAFSPTMVVYANEIIRQARLFSGGFILDEQSIALNEILQSGSGGNYLTSELTMNNFREISEAGCPYWPVYSLENWQNAGHPKADELLRKYTLELIASLSEPDGFTDMIQKGNSWITHFLKK